MTGGRHGPCLLSVLVYICLFAISQSARLVDAAVDEARDFSIVDEQSNITPASNPGQDDLSSTFGGDATRFARQGDGLGLLTYQEEQGISEVSITIFALTSQQAGDWVISVSVGSKDVLQLTAQQLQAAFSASSGNTTAVDDFSFEKTSSDWTTGRLTVAVQHDEADGCEKAVTIKIDGGDAEAVQIGEVEILAVQDSGVCGPLDSDCPRSAQDCTPTPDESLRTFYDGCTRMQQLYHSENVQVATDNPKSFSNDKARLARRDREYPGTITYRFQEGGMEAVRASVALLLPSDDALGDINITVRPYVTADCKPPQHITDLTKLVLHPMANGWKFVEIEYSVGSLEALSCELAKFVEISFDAPLESDVQLMSLKLIGDGFISELQELDDPSINPNNSNGLLDESYIVWILVGVGTLFVVILGVLVWCCCGHPCCGRNRENLPGQVVIPVDCVVPDMPVSMDEESEQLHMGQKYAGMNPAHYSHAQMGLSPMVQGGGLLQHPPPAHVYAAGHVPSEPVVDLSVPVKAQPDRQLPPFAPRQGQDIFDTWQQAGGLSGYQSGEDYEEHSGGPLDTRERSFTGNPPVSSTGNTSPTQDSSVLGVTAQLGMRLKELKNLQGEHERVAKGQADSNGDFAATPEPLGVKYGRKIGVGGFGAVYEGEWAGKSVAIKVIKMPHSQKQSDDKEKMAFMEYAISGILIHKNIVQTYQADIRPVFLDDDTETATVSKSGWTGLGEFLSNEAISQKMQKTMRIQEWELRLVMEMCNKGNLKEAIRQKSLMKHDSVKAMEVALLALDIAKACQAIHKHNIIHGDLKPHNVLLTQEPDDERGWVGKIADFGLSVKIKRGEQHVSGIQHGTEGYVAPEVLQTRRMVKASDVYSFGIIMWELWHARLYYEEYRHAQRRMRRVTLDFRPTFERGCPEEWINLAKSCWSLRPEERPDFDRVVKMMKMIIATIRDKINTEGVITESN